MSYRKERLGVYSETHLNEYIDPYKEYSLEDLGNVFLLHDKVHGICFSAYSSNQMPGAQLSYEQVKLLMLINKLNKLMLFSEQI